MPQKLPLKDFLKSFEYAPRLAIELLVENPKGELLLIKREQYPFEGQWHLPGGYLLKDEAINDCIERIAKDEVGLSIDINKVEKCELFETLDGDPRGHIIHYPIKIKADAVADKSYFAAVPKNTIDYQIRFLKILGYKIEE